MSVRSRHVVISARAIRRHSGASRIWLALAGGFAADGHRVDVVADRMPAATVRAHGATPRYPARTAAAQAVLRGLLGRDVLAALRDRRVRSLGADLVIGDGESARQHVALIHNIIPRAVESMGAVASRRQRADAEAQARTLARGAFDLVVTNSRLAREDFMARFGVDEGRIAVVHPAVDGAVFGAHARQRWREPVRARLGVGPGDFLLAFVSSGNAELRGGDILAAALAQLPVAVRQRLKVLCVTSDKGARRTQESFARHGLRLPLLVVARSENVEQYYGAADLLVHPARFETFGLVVMEAAACGCPVLTSAAVGAAELFTGAGATGVVDSPSADGFAPALAALVEDPERLRVLADAQAAAARARDWPLYCAEFKAALRARGLW